MRFILKHSEFIIILIPPESLILGALPRNFKNYSSLHTSWAYSEVLDFVICVIKKKAANWLPFLFCDDRLSKAQALFSHRYPSIILLGFL